MADPCPSAETLLSATSGELSSRDGRALVAHLRTCASCRATLGGMVKTFMIVAANSGHDVSPEEKKVATARFVAALHARRQAAIHERTVSLLMNWLPAAAVIGVVLVGAMLTRASVVVQADEVLREALLRARPYALATDSWLRIDVRPVFLDGRPRVPSLSTMRPARESRPVTSAPAWRDALPVDVVAGLDEYEVDWEDPFRVDRYQAWRQRLSRKRDAVTRRTNEIVVTTWPVDAALEEVELVLDRTSYQAVRVAWTLAGIGRMEVTRSEAPPRNTPSARTEMAAAGRIDPAALLDAELDVRLALRRAGVDVGGVRIANTGTSVVVTGNVASRSEFTALATQLRVLPAVEFRVRHAYPARFEAPMTVAPKIAERLDRTFAAGNEQRPQFVPAMVEQAARIDERVRALNALADRYSATIADGLSAGARVKLQRLLDLHFAALNADLTALDTRLSVLAGTSAPSRALPLTVAPDDWRQRTRAVAASPKSLRASVERFVTSDRSGLEAPSGPREQLTRIWDAVNAPARFGAP